MPKYSVLLALVTASALFALPATAAEKAETSWDFHKAQTAVQEGNYEKAVPVLRRFAEQGSAAAQWQLGGLFMNGSGVHKDTAMAAMWYRKALAEVPADIPDDPPEPGRTFRDDWNLLILELSHLRIMCPQITAALGAMHFKGDGVPKDDIESYKWFELAKHYGHPKAETVQEFVGENLTDDQIAEAEKRASSWLAEHTHYDDTLLKRYLPQ